MDWIRKFSGSTSPASDEYRSPNQLCSSRMCHTNSVSSPAKLNLSSNSLFTCLCKNLENYHLGRNCCFRRSTLSLRTRASSSIPFSSLVRQQCQLRPANRSRFHGFDKVWSCVLRLRRLRLWLHCNCFEQDLGCRALAIHESTLVFRVPFCSCTELPTRRLKDVYSWSRRFKKFMDVLRALAETSQMFPRTASLKGFSSNVAGWYDFARSSWLRAGRGEIRLRSCFTLSDSCDPAWSLVSVVSSARSFPPLSDRFLFAWLDDVDEICSALWSWLALNFRHRFPATFCAGSSWVLH